MQDFSFSPNSNIIMLKIPLAITLSYVPHSWHLWIWGFAITVAVTISLFTFMKSVQPHYSLYPKRK
jgi:hypothetical protein